MRQVLKKLGYFEGLWMIRKIYGVSLRDCKLIWREDKDFPKTSYAAGRVFALEQTIKANFYFLRGRAFEKYSHAPGTIEVVEWDGSIKLLEESSGDYAGWRARINYGKDG